MTWGNTYHTGKHVWGDKPSELAAFAVGYLQKAAKSQRDTLEILDAGCGYGRDSLYLARSFQCNVLGIDNTREAIQMAQETLPAKLESQVHFELCDFKQIIGHQFDVVFVSNLYQVLEAEDRKALRNFVKHSLKRKGMLFLSTLSASDPEHSGKGRPVENESNSFRDEKYIHLCTRDEIVSDFGFLTVKELLEHEYDEPRSNGVTHHHISWLFLGIN